MDDNMSEAMEERISIMMIENNWSEEVAKAAYEFSKINVDLFDMVSLSGDWDEQAND